MPDTIPVVVDSLYIYPVKACAALAVDRIDFDEDGLLVGDREWAVVDGQCSVVWQGAYPNLALVVPALTGGVLSLRAAGDTQAGFTQGPDREPCQVRIWNEVTQENDTYAAMDEGDAAAAFLLRAIGAPLRLVQLGPMARCRHGLNAVHLVSRASHAELCAALAADPSLPISVERFRPNVVLSGQHEPLMPFIEEHFSTLEWTHAARSARLSVDALCVRCVVPNVDPVTASVDERVLQTVGHLSAQRHPGKPVYFGAYARASACTALHRGEVLSASMTF